MHTTALQASWPIKMLSIDGADLMLKWFTKYNKIYKMNLENGFPLNITYYSFPLNITYHKISFLKTNSQSNINRSDFVFI